MARISTGDFRKGVKVIIDDDPYEMLECNFVKPGKGQALYKTRLRNLLKGTILDRTYKSDDGLEAADVHRGEGQYLYRDASGYVFMDNETYEQYTLSEDACAEQIKFMKEGMNCGLLFWNAQLIEMTPPQHIVLEVIEADPAAKGNTATNVTKPVKVETGATVHCPAFVKEGDKIKIDAADGSYIERVRD